MFRHMWHCSMVRIAAMSSATSSINLTFKQLTWQVRNTTWPDRPDPGQRNQTRCPVVVLQIWKLMKCKVNLYLDEVLEGWPMNPSSLLLVLQIKSKMKYMEKFINPASLPGSSPDLKHDGLLPGTAEIWWIIARYSWNLMDYMDNRYFSLDLKHDG